MGQCGGAREAHAWCEKSLMDNLGLLQLTREQGDGFRACPDEENWVDERRPVKEWYLRPNPDDNTIAFPEAAYGAVTYLDLALGTVELRQQPEANAATNE